MLYFEDIEVGSKSAFGSYKVTREEMIEFASKFDPQPFHLDDEAAAKTHFGKISASGWHTGSMMMRMLVDNLTVNKMAALGSPGIDELRWIKPVYAGDVLRCENEILSKRQSKSKPEIGTFHGRTTVYNQNDEAVMMTVSIMMVMVRGSDKTKNSNPAS